MCPYWLAVLFFPWLLYKNERALARGLFFFFFGKLRRWKFEGIDFDEAALCRKLSRSSGVANVGYFSNAIHCSVLINISFESIDNMTGIRLRAHHRNPEGADLRSTIEFSIIQLQNMFYRIPLISTPFFFFPPRKIDPRKLGLSHTMRLDVDTQLLSLEVFRNRATS